MGLEQVSAILLASGLVCLAAAAAWIWIAAWKTSWKWGLGLTLFAPAGLWFIAWNYPRVKRPCRLAIFGLARIAVPFAVNAVVQRIDLGPRERIVDGETHITLTGWHGKDYSILRERSQVAVLQMANADVTDQTLEFVRGFRQLKEIDLNDTQITDAGLVILKALPALTTLRLKGTKITDEGFQRELVTKETLMELDLRETSVASKSLRQWKNAKDGRKYLK